MMFNMSSQFVEICLVQVFRNVQYKCSIKLYFYIFSYLPNLERIYYHLLDNIYIVREQLNA